MISIDYILAGSEDHVTSCLEHTTTHLHILKEIFRVKGDAVSLEILVVGVCVCVRVCVCVCV